MVYSLLLEIGILIGMELNRYHKMENIVILK